jgi:transcription antitermination factor NusG
MLKLSDNPPMRLEAAKELSDLDGQWWVAHTKSRAEKALAWDLIAAKIPYFLPMADKVSYWGGRKRKVLVPIFSSYLFFCGDSTVRHRVMTTNRVCQTIPVRQRDQFVAEIKAIDRALETKMELDLYPFATVGRTCRVRQGPLQGIEGVIVRKDGATRIVLQVKMLGQGVGLEISPDLLEPID